jgi:hypothetical protein
MLPFFELSGSAAGAFGLAFTVVEGSACFSVRDLRLEDSTHTVVATFFFVIAL